ncbi:MAG: anion transporter [Bacteroidetes bacterium]|nr:MAG: anion transporter [Bacteroidota bacterium]PTM13296.1 MAG: anion transporter [Bacteroidota bacterium]
MKKIGLFLGLSIFAVLLLLPPLGGLSVEAWRVLAIAAVMLVWWVSEAVPIPVTALLPMVLLPALQVYDMKTAAAPYASPIVFLFMGGFMLALAMEKWNLHRRIALTIVRLTGTNANGIILGFMLATGFLSMWISNTATAVMMLPIAVSVVDLLSPRQTDEPLTPGVRAFGISIMLGIAYAANIGGTATLVGTPPNVVFSGFIKNTYGIEVSFATWLSFAFPFALALLLITYLLLTRFLFPNGLGRFSGGTALIEEELQQLGPITFSEQRTLVVFALTALAWIFRSPLNGLLGLTGEAIQLSDEMIAIFATVALFLLPSNWQQGDFLLSWSDTSRLPWGILLLFGGGLSLADALKAVGLIDLIGNQFTGLDTTGFWVIIGLTTVSLFLTEVMSNVALVTVFLPVVGAVAVGMGLDPILLCIPVTLAASCAFMLPMSTPPNAIVFASGKLQITDMARAGIWLNLVAIILIGILAQWVLPWVLG